MSERVRIKICGLTHPDDMRHAIACGADFVGLVFAPSPRRVDADRLSQWLESARGSAEVVGVFRDASIETVLAAVERFDLDLVQLHGDERGAAWQRLPLRLIEARLVDAGALAPARFAGAAWAQLLDAGAGSGQAFEWSIAAPVARAQRVFLAGGLSAENVGAAIAAARPFAVDASSRLERTPGRKDPALVARFCDAVRAAKEPSI
jgi:phosphoribosylanthranilate isomerase